MNTTWTAYRYYNYFCVEFVANNRFSIIVNVFTVFVLFHSYTRLNVARLKACFHYGCAALRCALRAIVRDSDMSRFIALPSSALLSQRYRNTNFQLIDREPFPLQLRCAARCDRYRNADSVSISIATRSAALLFTIAAQQRSRSGNTL